MKQGFRLAIATCAASMLIGSAGSGRTVTYSPAEERTPAALSGPSAETVVANCSACHSLDYITTQPRGKGPQFWHDAVTKMINVYKAPVAPADIDPIAAELTRRFG